MEHQRDLISAQVDYQLSVITENMQVSLKILALDPLSMGIQYFSKDRQTLT